MEPNDLLLWVDSHRALVAGDTLLDRGEGLVFPLDWADRGTGEAPEKILERLRDLLDLPIELVLPTHGAPADRAALEPLSRVTRHPGLRALDSRVTKGGAGC